MVEADAGDAFGAVPQQVLDLALGVAASDDRHVGPGLAQSGHDLAGLEHPGIVTVYDEGRDEDGQLDSLLITILDVSDRREIEMELIRQFSFLQALLDTIPNPIFYKGENTRFLEALPVALG